MCIVCVVYTCVYICIHVLQIAVGCVQMCTHIYIHPTCVIVDTNFQTPKAMTCMSMCINTYIVVYMHSRLLLGVCNAKEICI